MKNPESKPLRLVRKSTWDDSNRPVSQDTKALVLSNLAVAEATLVRAGKDSAMPHFIALVKEIESLLGMKFEIIGEESDG